MKRATALIDRILVTVLGLALLAAGAFGLAWYFEVPFAVEMISRFDRDAFAALPAQSWWNAALAATVVIGALLGVGLLIGNLSPRRTGTLVITDGQSLGIRVELDPLARAVAAEIAQYPGVDSARGRAIDDRGTATLAVAVRASRHLDVETFTSFAHARAAFVAEAVEGRAVALRVQLHL